MEFRERDDINQHLSEDQQHDDKQRETVHCFLRQENNSCIVECGYPVSEDLKCIRVVAFPKHFDRDQFLLIGRLRNRAARCKNSCRPAELVIAYKCAGGKNDARGGAAEKSGCNRNNSQKDTADNSRFHVCSSRSLLH